MGNKRQSRAVALFSWKAVQICHYDGETIVHSSHGCTGKCNLLEDTLKWPEMHIHTLTMSIGITVES